MATFTKTPTGIEQDGIRAVKTASGLERIGEIYLKTASGLVKIYESVRSCFGSGRWIGRKPWRGKDRWKYPKATRKYIQDNGFN